MQQTTQTTVPQATSNETTAVQANTARQPSSSSNAAMASNLNQQSQQPLQSQRRNRSINNNPRVVATNSASNTAQATNAIPSVQNSQRASYVVSQVGVHHHQNSNSNQLYSNYLMNQQAIAAAALSIGSPANTHLAASSGMPPNTLLNHQHQHQQTSAVGPTSTAASGSGTQGSVRLKKMVASSGHQNPASAHNSRTAGSRTRPSRLLQQQQQQQNQLIDGTGTVSPSSSNSGAFANKLLNTMNMKSSPVKIVENTNVGTSSLNTVQHRNNKSLTLQQRQHHHQHNQQNTNSSSMTAGPVVAANSSAVVMNSQQSARHQHHHTTTNIIPTNASTNNHPQLISQMHLNYQQHHHPATTSSTSVKSASGKNNKPNQSHNHKVLSKQQHVIENNAHQSAEQQVSDGSEVDDDEDDIDLTTASPDATVIMVPSAPTSMKKAQSAAVHHHHHQHNIQHQNASQHRYSYKSHQQPASQNNTGNKAKNHPTISSKQRLSEPEKIKVVENTKAGGSPVSQTTVDQAYLLGSKFFDKGVKQQHTSGTSSTTAQHRPTKTIFDYNSSSQGGASTGQGSCTTSGNFMFQPVQKIKSPGGGKTPSATIPAPQNLLLSTTSSNNANGAFLKHQTATTIQHHAHQHQINSASQLQHQLQQPVLSQTMTHHHPQLSSTSSNTKKPAFLGSDIAQRKKAFMRVPSSGGHGRGSSVRGSQQGRGRGSQNRVSQGRGSNSSNTKQSKSRKGSSASSNGPNGGQNQQMINNEPMLSEQQQDGYQQFYASGNSHRTGNQPVTFDKNSRESLQPTAPITKKSKGKISPQMIKEQILTTNGSQLINEETITAEEVNNSAINNYMMQTTLSTGIATQQPVLQQVVSANSSVAPSQANSAVLSMKQLTTSPPVASTTLNTSKNKEVVKTNNSRTQHELMAMMVERNIQTAGGTRVRPTLKSNLAHNQLISPVSSGRHHHQKQFPLNKPRLQNKFVNSSGKQSRSPTMKQSNPAATVPVAKESNVSSPIQAQEAATEQDSNLMILTNLQMSECTAVADPPQIIPATEHQDFYLNGGTAQQNAGVLTPELLHSNPTSLAALNKAELIYTHHNNKHSNQKALDQHQTYFTSDSHEKLGSAAGVTGPSGTAALQHHQLLSGGSPRASYYSPQRNHQQSLSKNLWLNDTIPVSPQRQTLTPHQPKQGQQQTQQHILRSSGGQVTTNQSNSSGSKGGNKGPTSANATIKATATAMAQQKQQQSAKPKISNLVGVTQLGTSYDFNKIKKGLESVQYRNNTNQNHYQQNNQNQQYDNEKQKKQQQEIADKQQNNAGKTPENKTEEQDEEVIVFSENHSMEDYVIGKQIGQGAYATVHIGVHKKYNKKVALKIYLKEKMKDLQRKKSVRREIKLMKRLDHPNIAKLYDAIETESKVILVMEFVGGGSTHGFLKSKPNRQMEESEAKKIFAQLISALNYLHSKCIAHRDIKLENVMLDHRGNVKLIDFGFSTQIPNTQKIKLFCGTPSYMAPEIVKKIEFCGPPADVYAAGVLLFAFFCGCFPYRGKDDKDLYKKIANDDLVIPDHVPPSPKHLIARMLQKDPEHRPTSQELYDEQWVQSGIFSLRAGAAVKEKHQQTRSNSIKRRNANHPQHLNQLQQTTYGGTNTNTSSKPCSPSYVPSGAHYHHGKVMTPLSDHQTLQQNQMLTSGLVYDHQQRTSPPNKPPSSTQQTSKPTTGYAHHRGATRRSPRDHNQHHITTIFTHSNPIAGAGANSAQGTASMGSGQANSSALYHQFQRGSAATGEGSASARGYSQQTQQRLNKKRLMLNNSKNNATAANTGTNATTNQQQIFSAAAENHTFDNRHHQRASGNNNLTMTTTLSSGTTTNHHIHPASHTTNRNNLLTLDSGSGELIPIIQQQSNIKTNKHLKQPAKKPSTPVQYNNQQHQQQLRKQQQQQNTQNNNQNNNGAMKLNCNLAVSSAAALLMDHNKASMSPTSHHVYSGGSNTPAAAANNNLRNNTINNFTIHQGQQQLQQSQATARQDLVLLQDNQTQDTAAGAPAVFPQPHTSRVSTTAKPSQRARQSRVSDPIKKKQRGPQQNTNGIGNASGTTTGSATNAVAGAKSSNPASNTAAQVAQNSAQNTADRFPKRKQSGPSSFYNSEAYKAYYTHSSAANQNPPPSQQSQPTGGSNQATVVSSQPQMAAANFNDIPVSSIGQQQQQQQPQTINNNINIINYITTIACPHSSHAEEQKHHTTHQQIQNHQQTSLPHHPQQWPEEQLQQHQPTIVDNTGGVYSPTGKVGGILVGPNATAAGTLPTVNHNLPQ